MRVNGSLLKDQLLNSNPVEQKNVQSGALSPSNTTTTNKSHGIRPSHGFPRTNVEKSYKDAMNSFEDVSSAAATELLAMTHQNLDYIANTVTATDANHAKAMGFLPENTSVEGYVTVIDKIKIYMAMGNDDFQNYGDTLSSSEIARITGSSSVANKIANKMARLDVPQTEDNIQLAMKAVAEGEKIEPLTDGDKKYLIENDVLPTIENLYKAEHASLPASDQVSEAVWNEVEPQALAIIEEAGLIGNDETIDNAKWLLANELPVTAENLYAKAFFDGLNLPASIDDLITATGIAMNRGQKPMNGLILGDNLETEYITHKRELLEARAILYAEGARTMEKNGMEPNIKEITIQLEAVEAQEREYYSRLMNSEGIEVTEEKLDQLLQTLDLTEQFKVSPEYVLGRKPLDMTLPEAAKEGQNLKANLDRINERYETVMTRPRADMGDSINKAFRNIPDILADLGLEATRENAKAVRILAYNQMPINIDNISNMKNVDMAVTETLDAVKPATVMHMIKNDINPLNLTMTELRNTALTINETFDYEGSEKYSEFLWKAQQGDLTEAERDSYIGIYRMLRSIEKSDGAVIGALVNSGAELTINNLMTAVRSRKKTGMELSVDDKTDVKIAAKDSVNPFTMQAESAFTKEHPGKESRQDAQNTYQSMMIRKALKEMSPQDLKDADSKKPVMDQTLEELFENVAASFEENPEKEMASKQLDLQYEQLRLNRFGGAYTAEDDVLRLLGDNDLPMDLYNILASRDIQGRRNSRYDRLFKASDAASMEEVKAEIIKKLGESIKSPKEMAEAMETLGDVAENVMKGMINDEDSTLYNIQNARMMHAQMELTLDLSKNEHYDIPVIVGDEVAGVSLKIVRGKRDKGKVDVVFDLGKSLGGKVAAEFILKENACLGTIAAENKETLELLRNNCDSLRETMEGEQGKALELHFAEVKDLNIDRFLQTEKVTPDSTEEEYEVQTRQLYGAAKQFMSYVKATIDRYY